MTWPNNQLFALYAERLYLSTDAIESCCCVVPAKSCGRASYNSTKPQRFPLQSRASSPTDSLRYPCPASPCHCTTPHPRSALVMSPHNQHFLHHCRCRKQLASAMPSLQTSALPVAMPPDDRRCRCSHKGSCYFRCSYASVLQISMLNPPVFCFAQMQTHCFTNCERSSQTADSIDVHRFRRP